MIKDHDYYYEQLKESDDYDCSCHIDSPCSSCTQMSMDAQELADNPDEEDDE